MALVKCSACGADVSDRATACPKCARPIGTGAGSVGSPGAPVIVHAPGSAGGVVAGIASFFIPGLGQLVQGRLFAAAVQFVCAGMAWFVFLGWLVHLYSAYDAATYRGR